MPEVTTHHTIIYDGMCEICRGQIANIKRFDGRNQLRSFDMHEPDLEERFPDVRREDCYDAMHLVSPDGTVYRGAEAVREIVRQFPWIGWMAHLFALPGAMWMAHRAYAWIARNRYRFNRNSCESGACELHLNRPHPHPKPEETRKTA